MVGRHRLEPRRHARLRRGRVIAAGAAAAITAVALLGGMGLVPLPGPEGAGGSGANTGASQRGGQTEQTGQAGQATGSAAASSAGQPTASPEPGGPVTPPAVAPTPTAGARAKAVRKTAGSSEAPTALPASSGTGRRIVFSIPQQRVWLVDDRGRAVSTYLVSGSVLDNLKPGSYSVYSRSRWATGIQDSGVMQYFVRFTRGRNAAIGFHTIPTKNGVPLQSTRQLGTPQSHGCIRQRTPDAIRLWDFAPIGTKVVVV